MRCCSRFQGLTRSVWLRAKLLGEDQVEILHLGEIDIRRCGLERPQSQAHALARRVDHVRIDQVRLPGVCVFDIADRTQRLLHACRDTGMPQKKEAAEAAS